MPLKHLNCFSQRRHPLPPHDKMSLLNIYWHSIEQLEDDSRGFRTPRTLLRQTHWSSARLRHLTLDPYGGILTGLVHLLLSVPAQTIPSLKSNFNERPIYGRGIENYALFSSCSNLSREDTLFKERLRTRTAQILSNN